MGLKIPQKQGIGYRKGSSDALFYYAEKWVYAKISGYAAQIGKSGYNTQKTRESSLLQSSSALAKVSESFLAASASCKSL